MNRETKDILIWGGGVLALFLGGAFVVWLVAFRSGLDVEQVGYDGVGLQQQQFSTDVQAQLAAFEQSQEAAAEALAINGYYDFVEDDGTEERAGDVYENVQVLGHLSISNFTRFMAAITAWVAPNVEDPAQGCGYCHNGESGVIENMASDWNYAKVVARRMIQMTQFINEEYRSHVGDAGVNCYTCHRGQNVPQYLWFFDPASEASQEQVRFIGERNGQNEPVPANGYTDLNVDPFSAFMLEYQSVAEGFHRVPITTEPNQPLQHTEHVYSLMINWSRSLGVNCTYCHNSRAFGSWAQSPPARTTAWHGRRMAAVLNARYLAPLTPVYPQNRLGPLGDAPKLNCATCHQGVNQPLYGQDMRTGFPTLQEQSPATGQDAAFWPTLGGPAPEGWPQAEGTRYQTEEERAAQGTEGEG